MDCELFRETEARTRLKKVNVRSFVEDTLGLCMERMRNHGVRFSADPIDEKLVFYGRGTEISQVLVNLLNNADDAISKLPEKWITLSVQNENDWLGNSCNRLWQWDSS